MSYPAQSLPVFQFEGMALVVYVIHLAGVCLPGSREFVCRFPLVFQKTLDSILAEVWGRVTVYFYPNKEAHWKTKANIPIIGKIKVACPLCLFHTAYVFSQQEGYKQTSISQEYYLPQGGLFFPFIGMENNLSLIFNIIIRVSQP